MTAICKRCIQELPISEFLYGKRVKPSSICRPCDYKRIRDWVNANKEAVKAYMAEYHQANRETALQKRKRYYQENKEKYAAYSREYRAANQQSIIARRIRYKEVSGEKVRASGRERYRRKREDLIPKHVVYTRNRRARVRSSEGRHTAKDIESLFLRQGAKCATCKTSIRNGYDVDHIMPIALGGSNWPDNLQLLCQSCNRRKNAKHPEEWAKLNGLLF